MSLRVKNWSEYQGYEKRGPRWLKLHVGLLNDPAWIRLPVASKALLPALWIVAAGQGTEGYLPEDVGMLAILSHMAQADVRSGLPPLVAAGFLLKDDHCDGSVALVATEVSGEERRVEESRDRGERDTDSRPSVADSPPTDAPGRVPRGPGASTQREIERLESEADVARLGQAWATAMGRSQVEVGILRAAKRALLARYDVAKIELAIKTLGICRATPERFQPRNSIRWTAENKCSPDYVLRPETLDKLIPEAEAWWRD